MVRMHKMVALGLLGALVMTPACGKKKSNDDTSTNVTSVDAGTSSASTASLSLRSDLDLVPASSASTKLALAGMGDYEADQSHFHVQDNSMDALSTIGTILCFLSQTGYNHPSVVNKGNYIAQVDMDKCESDHGGGGGGGGGASGKEVNLINVIVNAERPEGKPLSANFWFDMKGHGDGSVNDRLAIRLIIAEGASDKNPYGIFRFEFKQGPVGGAANGSGVMEAKRASVDGDVLITFTEKSDEGANGNRRVQVAAQAHPEGEKVTGGVANIDQYEKRKEGGKDKEYTSKFKLAFSTDHFLANDVANSKSVCKDLNNFKANVWRYGMYNAADGSRLKITNPSISIGFKKGDKFLHGNASYYGIWMEGNISLKTGDTVVKDNYGDKTAAEVKYTVVAGDGKLQKHTRVDIKDLKEIDGIELYGFSGSSQTRLVYNKAKGYFEVNATASQSNGQPNWVDKTPEKVSLSTSFPNNFYSQALGGNVTVLANTDGTPKSAFYYKDQDVTASAGDLTLNCFQQCLKTNLSTTDMASMDFMNSPAYYSAVQTLTTPYIYKFSGSGMKLTYGDVAVGPATGATASQMGMRSGALIDDAAVAKLVAAGKNVWEVMSADVYYTWEFGPNAWQKYVGLKDSAGKAVAFDAPVPISYKHTAANDAANQTSSPYFDKVLHFNWTGDGHLDIPGVQDSESGYWVPRFGIKTGAKAGDKEEYLIKALDGQLYMNKLDASACSTLSVDSMPELPALDSFDEAHANNDPMPDAAALSTLIVQGTYVGK